MTDVVCFVGLLRQTMRMPSLRLGGRTIPDFFDWGSNGAINLLMDESRAETTWLHPDDPANAINLQFALHRLTRNKTGVNRVSKIGLIIADQFASHPGILGCMFDLGFNTSDIGNMSPTFTNVPREGCAIFLDAITRLRPDPVEFRRELVFTAIHELGHVFNLWHIENRRNFMATSPRGPVTLPPAAFRFHEPQHISFLERADESRFVWPGGSLFGDRGPHGPRGDNPYNGMATPSRVKLHISINQNDFWYFEPIELDIRLSLKKGERAVLLPDEIDPGYERFGIHITRPDGTSFWYRSPRIFCRNAGLISITPGKPFVRDVSIFGQSGGYTFSAPGIYKIQAFLKLPGAVVVRSNVVECNLKTPLPAKNTRFQQQLRLLTSPDVGQMLYHRSGRLPNVTFQTIEDFSHKYRKEYVGQNANYALARWIWQNKRLIKARPSLIQKATDLAKTALDSGLMSAGRAKNLSACRDSYS